jgi:hypothetical protein
MSFVTKVEGEVKAVVEHLEKQAETIAESVGKSIKTAESVIVKDIEAAFKKTMAEGKMLIVKIDSAGHFDPDGIGSATVIVTSKAVPVPVAPEVAKEAGPTSPPETPSKGEPQPPETPPPAASTPVQS